MPKRFTRRIKNTGQLIHERDDRNRQPGEPPFTLDEITEKILLPVKLEKKKKQPEIDKNQNNKFWHKKGVLYNQFFTLLPSFCHEASSISWAAMVNPAGQSESWLQRTGDFLGDTFEHTYLPGLDLFEDVIGLEPEPDPANLEEHPNTFIPTSLTRRSNVNEEGRVLSAVKAGAHIGPLGFAVNVGENLGLELNFGPRFGAQTFFSMGGNTTRGLSEVGLGLKGNALSFRLKNWMALARNPEGSWKIVKFIESLRNGLSKAAAGVGEAENARAPKELVEALRDLFKTDPKKALETLLQSPALQEITKREGGEVAEEFALHMLQGWRGITKSLLKEGAVFLGFSALIQGAETNAYIQDWFLTILDDIRRLAPVLCNAIAHCISTGDDLMPLLATGGKLVVTGVEGAAVIGGAALVSPLLGHVGLREETATNQVTSTIGTQYALKNLKDRVRSGAVKLAKRILQRWAPRLLAPAAESAIAGAAEAGGVAVGGLSMGTAALAIGAGFSVGIIVGGSTIGVYQQIKLALRATDEKINELLESQFLMDNALALSLAETQNTGRDGRDAVISLVDGEIGSAIDNAFSFYMGVNHLPMEGTFLMGYLAYLELGGDTIVPPRVVTLQQPKLDEIIIESTPVDPSVPVATPEIVFDTTTNRYIVATPPLESRPIESPDPVVVAPPLDPVRESLPSSPPASPQPFLNVQERNPTPTVAYATPKTPPTALPRNILQSTQTDSQPVAVETPVMTPAPTVPAIDSLEMSAPPKPEPVVEKTEEAPTLAPLMQVTTTPLEEKKPEPKKKVASDFY